MAVRPLIVEPHEVLRAVAAPVEQFDASVRSLVEDLIDTMRAHHGLGIAAPQIGVSRQVFIINGEPASVFINPILESVGGAASVREGCLSVPRHAMAVPRWEAIRLRAQGVSGELVSWDAHGPLAVVLQHEFDHLQGVLFMDRNPR